MWQFFYAVLTQYEYISILVYTKIIYKYSEMDIYVLEIFKNLMHNSTLSIGRGNCIIKRYVAVQISWNGDTKFKDPPDRQTTSNIILGVQRTTYIHKKTLRACQSCTKY